MNVLGKLLFIFITLPMIELAILVWLGSRIGFWPTMAIVVITGVVGASLARYQGFMVYSRIRTDLNSGRVPAGPLIDGLLILIGGLLLLTPGLLTDTVGLLLLIPWARSGLKEWLRRKFARMVQSGQTQFFFHSA